jgi:lipopolysaccharide/colanic/teichoic acid biosynthesis glycosyltransferase
LVLRIWLNFAIFLVESPMTTFYPPIAQDQLTKTWEERGAEPSACVLFWRQKQLLVRRRSHQRSTLSFPPLADQYLLAECLKRSPVRLVRVDAGLGEDHIRAWADACEQAGKSTFLRVPSASRLPRGYGWILKRIFDWTVAALLLVALSPLFLVIVLLMKLSMPGPILFQQWRVGQRGKLFRVLKFRTMIVNAEKFHHQVMAGQSQDCLHKREDDPRITALGRFLRRSSLDELPQLINVLCGEMSLVGPRPWALYDAVRVRPDVQERLNALPGITGAWQVESRSTLLDLDKVNDRDLEYLHNWSLIGDLRILLRTVPKVLSGFGAY